jgi:hypothetical protein
MLFLNVGINSDSTSAFGLELSGIFLGPCLLPDRLPALETLLSGLSENVPLGARQSF